MKYLNQLEFSHIPYPTDLSTPGSSMQHASVKEAGCGLCSICMVIDRLTMKHYSLRQCAALSHKVQADLKVGTDMRRLGPAAAKKFGLDYLESNDIAQAVQCMEQGGCVICNVGGDQPEQGYTGISSHGGHFIVLLSAANGEVCVLDPSWRQDKYEEPGREGKVRLDGKFAYCSLETLDKDASSRSPRYYLFRRSSASPAQNG